MKKTMILVLALAMLAVSLLSGCGGTEGTRGDQQRAPESTGILPQVDDVVPDIKEPEMDDGLVDDTDGIITEREPGADTGARPHTDTGGSIGNGNGTGATGGAGMSNGTGTAPNT